MGFLRNRGSNESSSDDAVRMTALVTEAESPLDNAIQIGKHFLSTIRIAIDYATPPIYTAAAFKLERDHWLVRGMSVPVMIDPAYPEGFQVLWDEVPGMEQLAAAREPALCDPIGTRAKVGEVVVRLTSTVDVASLPEELREEVERLQNRGGPPPDHFAEALDKARQEPAPSGTVRAVVVIAATTVTMIQDGGGGDAGFRRRTSEGKHDAVLSVHVPDREPYAVFVRDFNRPRKKADATGAGLPALVSTNDPSSVEVLWDEIPSIKEQAKDLISEAMERMQSAQAGFAQDQAQMEATIRAATERAATQPAPAAPPPGAQPIPAEVREQMISGAKLAFQYMKDPAQRQMLIEQYRLAGITLDDKGNVVS